MSERLHHNPDVPQPNNPLRLGREVVVFMGPEGAGKSTIAKKIGTETGKPRVAIGDIIRNIAAKPNAEYHDECRTMLEQSGYLEPELLSKILAPRFKQNDLADGFILDGGFRTLEESQSFPNLLENSGRPMPVTAVYLHIPTSMSLERLVTGPHARRRAGETEEGVHKRLDNHYNNLYQRIKSIEEQQWQIHYIDATGTINQTTEKVRTQLRSRQ
jgi:adenylate kinase